MQSRIIKVHYTIMQNCRWVGLQIAVGALHRFLVELSQSRPITYRWTHHARRANANTARSFDYNNKNDLSDQTVAYQIPRLIRQGTRRYKMTKTVRPTFALRVPDVADSKWLLRRGQYNTMARAALGNRPYACMLSVNVTTHPLQINHCMYNRISYNSDRYLVIVKLLRWSHHKMK